MYTRYLLNVKGVRFEGLQHAHLERDELHNLLHVVVRYIYMHISTSCFPRLRICNRVLISLS